MSMNNLKIVVTLTVITIIIVVGFFVVFNPRPVERIEQNIPYLAEVEEPTVPFYSSNGGEK